MNSGGRENISRRVFLQGAAIGAAGVASLGFADISLAAESADTAQSASAQLGHTFDLDDVTLEDGSTSLPIEPLDPPTSWDQEFDIVVVGAGAGGLNAAAYAAQQGNSVLCIDKLEGPGGGSQQSTVFVCMMGGTRIQDSVKFALPTWPFDPDKATALALAMTKWADPDLMRALVVKGPETHNWMADLGVPWELDPQFGPTCSFFEGAMRDGFYPLGAKFLTDFMYEAGQGFGANYSFNTLCKGLVADDGRVVGVKITDIYDANVQFIRGKKAVILTAGGFAVNRAMLKKYCPDMFLSAVSSYAMPCDTGECTRMAVGVGADMAGWGSWGAYDGGLADYEQGNGPYHHYLYSGDVQIARQPWLGVDINGKKYRYVTSRPGSPTELTGLNLQADVEMRQTGRRGYVIFDGNFETYLAKSPERGCRYPIRPDMAGVERMPEWLAPHDWHVGFERALERGTIKKAHTLDELAEQLGFEPGVLPESVQEWNNYVATADLPDGTEDAYGYPAEMLNPINTPPYYGIRIGAQSIATSVGLHVNPQMQVIDVGGKVIPGLYAGFHTAGGQAGINGDSSVLPVLGGLGMSFTGGYIAAQYAINEEA